MNLIEQLGGYEKASEDFKKLHLNLKEQQKNNKVFMDAFDALKTELLEYRRQHNIFEVGDYVFHTVCRNPLLERVTWTDGKRIRTDLAGSSAPTETFVHANDEEIKAGKRLEVK